MQRTHRQRRAAERDAGSHGIRLSRGLRRVQCRQRGHGKPRARLRRAGVAAVPLASARTSRLGATREGDAQGRPGIEPARPWPVRRGKCCALHITGCSAKCRQSLARLAWCRHRSGGFATSAPCGFAEPPLCLAPLCTGRAAPRCRAASNPSCALALSRQRGPQRQNPRAPARPACRIRAASALRACAPRSVRHAPRPPPQAGAPRRAKANPGTVGRTPAVGPRRLAPCSPGQGFASPLRALDPAARGAGGKGPTALASSAGRSQEEHHGNDRDLLRIA